MHGATIKKLRRVLFLTGANSGGSVENASFHIGPPQNAYFNLHGRAEYKTHVTIRYEGK